MEEKEIKKLKQGPLQEIYFLIALLCLNFAALPAYGSCPGGNERNTNYIHRQDPDRCEVIVSEVYISTGKSLVFFSTGDISSFDDITQL